MTNLEICDALYADQEKLVIRANTLMPKISKQFKRDNKFPTWRWAEYTHQESHNRYLITFYAPSLEFADKPEIHSVAFMEADGQQIVVHCGRWMYRKRGSTEIYQTRYVGYYSGHFFSRYRERIWKGTSITRNELICRYFSRNIATIPLELNQNIQRNYKEYGELAKYAFEVPDGTCFIRHWNEGDETTIGQENCNFISVVLYCTFVNRGMMSKSQNKAIFKEGARFIRNYYKGLFEDAMKETFFRKLNKSGRQINKQQQNMPQMISIEECEHIGLQTETKVFNSVVRKLNERHQSITGQPYFDQLSKDLIQAEDILQDSFPEVHAEILSIMHDEYQSLDEMEQHCLFIYLFTNEKDENEIVDSMLWHFEEWMEELAYDDQSKAKS